MNLVDFESKVKALKVSFMKRLLDDNPGKWRKLASHSYNTQKLDFYFECNHKENPQTDHQFYTEVHNHWSELQRVKEIDSLLVPNQIIWNNRCITIENKPYMWRNWAGCGLYMYMMYSMNMGDFSATLELRENLTPDDTS